MKELSDCAAAAGKSIAYEAAIGGGIPCVKALREGLAANNVSKVYIFYI
jgi:homoserine dehydrogenase